MLARPIHRLTVLATLLGIAAGALAEDTARELRDLARADLRALLDETSLPGDVERHVRTAVGEIERTADSFVDGNHVSSKEVFDRFHQAAEAIREARMVKKLERESSG